MIKAAEITLYNEDDDEISIPLSPIQLQGICKLLGLQFDNGQVACFSDSSLKKFMADTIDKWELQ